MTKHNNPSSRKAAMIGNDGELLRQSRVRKGPSDKMMQKLKLEGRKEASHVENDGESEPAEDLCKGPGLRKRSESSKELKEAQEDWS